MTDDQRRAAVLGAIAKYTTDNTTSRTVARKALIKEGIYTKEGELRAEFGGPRNKSKTKSTRKIKAVSAA